MGRFILVIIISVLIMITAIVVEPILAKKKNWLIGLLLPGLFLVLLVLDIKYDFSFTSVINNSIPLNYYEHNQHINNQFFQTIIVMAIVQTLIIYYRERKNK